MLCLVGGMEWNGLVKIKGKQWRGWRKDLEKMRECEFVMIRIVKKIGLTRNKSFLPKFGGLRSSLGG